MQSKLELDSFYKVQGIPDHSPPGKLHTSKDKIWLFVLGNALHFFQVTLGFFEVRENDSVKIKSRIHVLLPFTPTGIKPSISCFSILEGKFHHG